MNVGYSTPVSAHATGALLRSFRLGVSVTALMLAGAALSPAMAQTRDLGTGTENRTSLIGFDRYTNGTLILTVPQAAPVTYGGQFTDGVVPFALTKAGIGTLTLTGIDQSDHSGATTVNSGLLLAGAARVLSPNSLLTINSARVDLGGFDQTVGGLSGSSAGVLTSVGGATLTINEGAIDRTYGGTIGGAVAIVKNGSGVLTLLRGSTYSGGTILNAGVIAYGNNTSFGSGLITIAGASELRANNQGRVIGNAIQLDAALSVLSSGFSTTFAGSIDGGGSLIKAGTGNLTLLNPTNGFSGGVNLSGGGGITIGGSGSLGSGLVTISGQTKIIVGGNFDANLQNDFAVNELVQFTLPGVGRTLELSGNLSGPGGVFGGVAITGGDGTLLVTGDNSGFSGGFHVGGFLPPNGGILAIGSATATGTGPITSNNPATIVFNGSYTIDNPILPGAALTIDTGIFDVGFTGDISNNIVQGTPRTGSLVKVGTGTLTLSGVGSYTGNTTVVDGSLLLADTASIGGDVSVGPGSNFGGTGNVAAGATVTVTGGSISPGNDGIGTLTIGSLFLDGTSTLNFQLRTPGIEGGAVNDLIVVSDALALDGTLLVSALPGFTTGSYRIINYGGALSGPGLTAGPAPTDFNFRIESGGGEVNLLVGFTGLRYWDGGNTSPNGMYDGGAGVWDSTATNWAISDGDANLAWDDGPSGVFGTVGGAVTVVDTQRFGNLRFDVGGYSFTGGALAVDNSTLDLNNAGTTVIDSTITGTGGLTKTGPGTLVLGGDNDFTGGYAAGAGTGVTGVTSNTALGADAATFGAGTTLRADAPDLIIGNALAVNGAFTIDTQAFGLTLDGAIGNSIDGEGGVTKAGTGSLDLTGASTYTGATSVLAGTLNIADSGSLGNTAVTVASGATLSGTGSIAGPVTIESGGILSAGGFLSPGGFGAGVGTLTTGALTLNAGANSNFQLGQANAIGGAFNDLIVVDGPLTLGGVLNVTESPGGNFTTGIYELFAYSGALTNNGFGLGSLLPNGRSGFIQAGLVPGQVNLIVTQSPSIVLNWDGADGVGNGVISGGTGIWNATNSNWTGNDPSALNSNWQSTVGVFAGTSGGTVTIDGTQSFEALQFGINGYTLVAGTGGLRTPGPGGSTLFASTGVSARIDAPISGDGSIVKMGGGTIILGSANQYTGGTRVAAGTLRLLDSQALGSNTATVVGATVEFGADLAVGNAFDLDGGGIFGPLTGTSSSLSGQISGNGGLVIGGAGANGTLTLANAGNDYVGGTTISSGARVVIADDGALGATTGGLGFTAGGGTLRTTADVSSARIISIATGSTATFDTVAGTTTLGGAIGGGGGLTKAGAGALNLTGASNYTGATAVVAGNLNIGTGGSLGNSAVTVASGATLSGTGSIAGPVTIASGGILSAGGFGSGVGTLTTGALTLNAGAISNFQLGAANTIAGAFNDRVVVNGALTLGGTLNVTQSLNGNFTTGIYELFAYTGALTNNGFALGSALPNGRSGFIQAGLVEGQVNLIVTQAPGIILYWDGADGIGNGIISGGGGRWTPTSTNWTGAAPSDLNTNWQSTVGVFQGTGGTVTIDGTQSFEALQFTGNGYTLVAGTGGLATPGPGGSTLFASTGVSARIDAPISGNGSIVKMGGGTIILGGNNLYTGGTDLQMGTLGVASNTALGTGALMMANGTTLQAAAPGLMLTNAIGIASEGTGTIDTNGNNLTLAGAITGGAVAKTGLGTLTLAGVNNFGGGLTISAGTVTGAVSGLGTGNILNNAALIINQPVDATLAQVISGTGTLTKTGIAVLTLSGVNPLTGPTTVNAGTLNVTGSLASSTTTVQTGATLTGIGTVGPLTVQSGGTVSPGSPGGSIGTLSVNGAFTLASGATYRADTSPSGAADRIVASGVATLAGNLIVNPGTGTYTTFNQSFTLVTGNSVTGTFGTASLGNFGPAFAPMLVYLPNSVSLRLAPASLVTQGGGTLFGNPLAVATAFDQAVAGGYNPQTFFALYNQGTNLSNALGQLSGELHSVERRVLLEETRVIREAAFDRLNAGLSAIAGSQVVTSEKGDAVVNSWYRGAGTWGRASADRIGARFTTEQVGFLTGIDYSKNGITVGGMFHHLSNRIQTSGFGQSTVETTGGAVYAGYRHDGGGLVVNAGLSASGNRAVGSRSITAPGLAQSLNSRISGNTYQAFGEIAFDLAASANARLEPFARFSYTWVRSGAFAETGSYAATFGARQTAQLGTSTLGLRGGMNVGAAQISGSAGWLHYTGDLDAPTLISITGVNTPARIRSAALPRNAFALQADASFRVSSQVTMGLGYSGALSSKYTDHGVRGTLTVGF
jgi:autotransporter-associated beta strand protein